MSPADLAPALESAILARRAPGAVLGLTLDGRRTILAAGSADARSGRPMSPHAACRLGSVSKVLTALLAVRLVEDGELDLEQPLRARWPSFSLATPDASAAVSLAHLLSHTSGLFGDVFDDMGPGPDALARYCARAPSFELTSAPGAAFSYCNAGFALAAHACERAAGLPWDTLLAQRLLRPLGMEATHALWTALPADRAVSHGLDGAPLPPDAMNRAMAPAGQAIWTDAADLLTLAEAVLDPGAAGLPGRASLEAMMRPRVRSPSPSFASSWGLGFAQFGPVCVGHDGAVEGQYAFWRLWPQARSALCLFVNGGDARAVFADLAAVIETRLGLASPPPPAWPDRTDCPPPPGLAGRYAVARYSVDVAERGGELWARFAPIGPTPDLSDPIEAPLRPDPDGPNGLYLARWPGQALPTHQTFVSSGGHTPEALVFRGRRFPRVAASQGG